MLVVLHTVLYKFAQQWTYVKEILDPWQGPCPSYLYLCPLSWLALIVRLWNISHTFFLCSLCQPLSSAGALVGQRQDTRLTNATVFPRKFWYYSESRTAAVLEQGTMHQNLVWHSHDLRWSWTSFARRKRNLVHWQCMAGNRGALQCILVNISKHKGHIKERRLKQCIDIFEMKDFQDT